MFAKIKNIQDGSQVETTFQFKKEMYKEGVFQFSPIKTANPEEWKGWWQIINVSSLQGFIYHESWLEPIE